MADKTPEQSQGQKQDDTIDPIRLFTPAVQHIIEGVAYLGRVTETVKLSGHTFGLQTLRPEYHYAIAQVIQPYRNTIIADKIWRNAHVAAALTHVDGRSDFCDSIGPNIEDFVQGRLNFISNKDDGWYEPTIEYLWYQYQILELKATKAVEQLNFLSQQTSPQPAFLQDLEDILNESESLTGAMNTGIPPSLPSNES
jgi:hypothetical protein